MTRLAPFLVAVGVLTTGCTSEEEPPPPAPEMPVVPPPIPVPDPDTFDTGGGLEAQPLKYARRMRLNAFIAWNAEEARVIDPVVGGATNFISALQITLADDDGFGNEDETDNCFVAVRLTDWQADPELEEGDVWRMAVPSGLAGPGIPGGQKEVLANCTENMFEVDQVPDGYTVDEYWAALPWELVLRSGNLNGSLTGQLLNADLNPDEYAQGAFEGNYTRDAFAHLTYWTAFEMDETGFVEGVGNQVTAQRIPREQLEPISEGNPPTAYYTFNQLFEWSLPDEITIQP